MKSSPLRPMDTPLYFFGNTPSNVLGNGRGSGLNTLRTFFKTPPLCFAQQNIGEVARSDGGVENDISPACLYRTYPCSPAVPRSIAGCGEAIGEVSARTEGLTPTAKKLMKSFQSLSSKLPFRRYLPYCYRNTGDAIHRIR